MNRPENLERELTVWFADTATPRVPDFTDDILRVTAGTRQRPRWTFSERWLPMSVITLARQTFKPIPWRAIGLLAVLALLLVAALAFYVGSQHRLPAPFGLAGNGLVAYSSGGDIYTVDPTTGVRKAIASGSETDVEPRFSPDGSRLVFIRGSDAITRLVIVDPAQPASVVTTEDFLDLDSDSIAWSPNGRSIVLNAQGLHIVDARTGKATALDVGLLASQAYWRPPDGRQLMLVTGFEVDLGLSLLTLADGHVEEVTAFDESRPMRASGWTPDGQRFVYQRGEHEGAPPVETHVLDVATGTEVIVDAGYAHVSNDGTRMVALDDQGWMCVVALSGGQCKRVGDRSQAYVGSHAGGVQWSPDDKWIITRQPGADGAASLVDPEGRVLSQPSWISGGAVSWQRVAP